MVDLVWPAAHGLAMPILQGGVLKNRIFLYVAIVLSCLSWAICKHYFMMRMQGISNVICGKCCNWVYFSISDILASNTEHVLAQVSLEKMLSNQNRLSCKQHLESWLHAVLQLSVNCMSWRCSALLRVMANNWRTVIWRCMPLYPSHN